MVDVIKTFFLNSGCIGYHVYPTRGNKTVGICSEGFLFGKVDKESNWIINKTFVSKEIAFDDQNKAGQKILAQFGSKLLLQLFDENSNERDNLYNADLVLSIAGIKRIA